jgi:hypothetical protein
MEVELNIPTQLFGGPPVLDNVIKMGESQIGFMNIFAQPLFEAVAHILPAMQFSVDEILTNKGVWEQKIEHEKENADHDNIDGVATVQSLDGMTGPTAEIPSPLSGSHVDLPGTEQLSTSLSADVDGRERSESNDLIAAALLVKKTKTSASPADRKQKDKGCASAPRLRSLSPTKRKAKSRERSSSKQDPTRPRTSPTNEFSGNGTPYAQMNGHVVSPPANNDGATDRVSSGKYLHSNSTTDVSSGSGKGRMSKFGFGKLWKKRWRTASGAGNPSPPLSGGNEERDGHGRGR